MAVRTVVGMATALTVGLCFSAAAQAETQAEQATLAPAEVWVTGLDAGRYAESWQAASTYMKTMVPSEDWVRTVQAARGALGKSVSRQVASTEYMTQLPGAPDGEYVVVQYATTFERKATATETVTLTKEGDGVWRVAGYYIR